MTKDNWNSSKFKKKKKKSPDGKNRAFLYFSTVPAEYVGSSKTAKKKKHNKGAPSGLHFVPGSTQGDLYSLLQPVDVIKEHVWMRWVGNSEPTCAKTLSLVHIWIHSGNV